jgi:hypothetical protein
VGQFREHLDVAQKAAREGIQRPLPPKVSELLAQEPAVEESDRLFMDAFWALSTCRSSGFGIGPIPWLAIDQYAQRHGYDDDQEFMTAFTAIMMEIDAGFRAWHAAHPPKAPPPPAGATRGGRRGRSS